MAQYLQVTSLEELHRLYPNLQLDNLEGIQCMIQDDQVAQYTDGQGQQVIATVEQSGMPLSQNPAVSQHCPTQQSQFVVHQPTQYVIQQVDTTDSQTPTVQYIQQTPVTQNKEDGSEVQLKDQNMGCIGTDIGSEDHSLHQCIIKQDGSQQFMPQVQQMLHQPIQIHQQIQAVDMGANILVLQNQEQQDLFLNSNKSQEVMVSPQEKQAQQQQQRQQHHQQIIIQGHPEHSPPQLVAQREQLIEKGENSQEYTQHQILQNRRPSQSGGQQQQIIHHPQQPFIQQLRYFNQVTVLDSFSQPNVTIEHHAPLNENIGQQQQVRSQVQQFRAKKGPQPAGIPAIIQQPQVLIPQRFEMSSTPVATRVSQIRKKGPQQDAETSSAPVFIVQKLDSPFPIRQPQTKIRFQSPSVNTDKVNENSYQSISTQSESNLETIGLENQQMAQSPIKSGQQGEGQQKNIVSGQPTQVKQFPGERAQNCTPVKIGIMEQPFGNRVPDQVNKIKVATTVSPKTPITRIKTTEQQTEPITVPEVQEIGVQQFQRWVGNVQPQTQQTSVISTQLQSPIQNPIQIPGRGRGLRGQVSPRGGHQHVPRARGVQAQTSPPRLPNVEGGSVGRRLKSPRGGVKGGRGGWGPCGLDQRPLIPVRVTAPQIVQNSASKGESSQTSNENVEEAIMVVLLLNGEKKTFKIPCSQQNILLSQILQQGGIVATPTSVAIEQVVDANSEHFVIKNNLGNNQQVQTLFKPSNIPQTVNVSTSVGTPRSVVATIQRPRGSSPLLPQATNMGIIRQRLHFVHPRLSSPSCSAPTTITSNIVSEAVTSQSQNSQTSTPAPQPPKEEPRFVSGFMAVCPFCGISSLDFNKCIRCRRKLPENVKSQSIFDAKKKKADKATGSSDKNSEDSKSELEKGSPGDEVKAKNTPVQTYEKKRPKPCIKKKKISDEPAEILILSSDEEEDSKSKKPSVNTPTLTVLRKEPVYTMTLTEADMANLLKESNLNEDLMKNVQPGSFTTLQCRTIRVGSYKVQPKERVLVSTKGIKLVVNSLKNENATIVIPITEILKVLMHFGKQIPVIFIYPIPKVGFQIRNILGMDNKMGPYYDPASTQEETHKRITLILEKITEDNKITLYKIFGQSKIEELSEKEANEILIRASPVDMQNAGLGKTCVNKDIVRKIMVYPPPPEKGGITLNNQDYACLGEDQFLNDVIIDFYLKYLLLKVLSPDDRNRTHVFSTFFYKRLTTKPKTLRKNDPENDPKLTPAEKRHMRVKGWTKQVNLFEKDFIIVPINEHSHWFLAIICFPGLTGPVRFSDNTPVEPEETIPKKNSQTVQIGSTTITHIIKADGNTISLEMDSGSDRDEAEGDQDDLHPSSDEEGSEQAEEESNSNSQQVQIPLLAPLPPTQPAAKDAKPKVIKRKAFKEPIKQPCILIFDSLAGASRVRVVATLRDYLKIEYKKKMGQERDFSKDTIKGAVPKVPQQNNFTDCGLYVLQYVESFFQDPLHDFKLPLKYLLDWFPEEVVSCKRQKLACLIRSLMEEQGIKVEEMGLPTLTFTNGSNPPDDQSRIEDEEMEEEEEMNEEEEEELMSSQVQISEFENEDDEDLNLEEEDLDDEEEDEDLDEEDEEEELQVGEVSRRWIARATGSCNELESSVKHLGGQMIIKTSPLVDYDPSDSDEDGQTLSHNSELVSDDQAIVHAEIAEESEYCDSEQPVVTENRRSVPLTEFQDFESQISCTTIERNLEGKNSESDMLISEDEEEEMEEENCSEAIDEEEASYEHSDCEKGNSVSDNSGLSSERKIYPSNEVLVKDGKAIEVNNIIKKLVNDKNITISRREEESATSPCKKQLEIRGFKVKDCDKGGEEGKKGTSSYLPQKNSVGTCKRTFQALKNVRIQKKTERKLELYSKRQKVDER